MKRLRMDEIVWPVDNPYRPPWAISCDEARKRCEQRRMEIAKLRMEFAVEGKVSE